MGHPAEIQALDYSADQQAVGHPAAIQAMDYPPDQQAVGHSTAIQAMDYPPYSSRSVTSQGERLILQATWLDIGAQICECRREHDGVCA